MQSGAIYWANFNENYGKLLTFFTEESSKERVFVLRLSGHGRSILLPPYFWQGALGPCFLCLQLYTEWTTELKKIYYIIILFGIYQCIQCYPYSQNSICWYLFWEVLPDHILLMECLNHATKTIKDHMQSIHAHLNISTHPTKNK